MWRPWPRPAPSWPHSPERSSTRATLPRKSSLHPSHCQARRGKKPAGGEIPVRRRRCGAPPPRARQPPSTPPPAIMQHHTTLPPLSLGPTLTPLTPTPRLPPCHRLEPPRSLTHHPHQPPLTSFPTRLSLHLLPLFSPGFNPCHDVGSTPRHPSFPAHASLGFSPSFLIPSHPRLCFSNECRAGSQAPLRPFPLSNLCNWPPLHRPLRVLPPCHFSIPSILALPLPMPCTTCRTEHDAPSPTRLPVTAPAGARPHAPLRRPAVDGIFTPCSKLQVFWQCRIGIVSFRAETPASI